MKKRNKSLIFTFGIGVLSILLVSYYIISPSRGEFHADTTDTIMWAEASINAKALFNEDFYYAASLPFGGHLIMIPYILIFGVSMTANILGMLTFMILLLLSMYYLTKTM